MKLFLDTSSLIKLYHEEPGTDIIDDIFEKNTVSAIILSELSKVEFSSALWKKCRTGELSEAVAVQIIYLFTKDSLSFIFVPVDAGIINSAIRHLDKYGAAGLRTLDSIQLATATHVAADADLFRTEDNLLSTLFIAESLPVI